MNQINAADEYTEEEELGDNLHPASNRVVMLGENLSLISTAVWGHCNEKEK
jgi:hypothetical protein